MLAAMAVADAERRHSGEVSSAPPPGRLRLARCQLGSAAQQFAMSASADRSLRIHPRSSPRLCLAARQQGAPGCFCRYANGNWSKRSQPCGGRSDSCQARGVLGRASQLLHTLLKLPLHCCHAGSPAASAGF